MKNFVRVCTAVLAVGVLLCIGGAAAGGKLYSSIVDGEIRPFGWWFPRMRGESQEDYDQRTGAGRDGGSVWEPAAPSVYGEPNLPDLADIPSSLPGITELKKLDFQLSAGEYYIVTGDAYGYSCNDADWLTSKVENGVWKLSVAKKWFKFDWDDTRICTITIPEGCTVEKAELSLGAADVEIAAPITAQKLEIETGAADVTFSAPVTVEKADLEVGAGSLSFSLLDASDEIDAEIGAGGLDMVLAGGWEDYSIRAEVAMGSISVNGKDLVAGFAGECSQGSGRRKIRLETGMGSAELYTEQ
ncbi:hypothetical protein D3Z48_14675 [Clostridiaceae bacterium]|nr:hypothetical protein [Clostridiaceae bacterium]RKJ79446.1 hypothetical protein D7X33_07995 [Butyricicoccus sp. 1XD8-22]